MLYRRYFSPSSGERAGGGGEGGSGDGDGGGGGDTYRNFFNSIRTSLADKLASAEDGGGGERRGEARIRRRVSREINEAACARATRIRRP